MNSFLIKPGQLSLNDCRFIFENKVQLELDPSCFDNINRSAETVQQVIDEKRTVYGINTGFGLLASTSIPDDKLQLLQESLVLSHAAGIGEALDENIVRLLIALKVSSLAQGYSGIRLNIIQTLLQLVNSGVYPVIPEKGSVGASGDLAPLAHMSCMLIGIGEVFFNGEKVSAEQALQSVNIKKQILAAKEGLALLNGTQASTAIALAGLFKAENCFASAIVAGCLSVDAALGSIAPFDSRIHQVRGHQGQIQTAAAYEDFLKDSDLLKSHAECEKVQDPYSLRCQPQVMGAILDQIRFQASVLLTEANAVSDNPLVFSDEGDIISGGNFHAEPVAIAADALAIAAAEIGAISERRIALLLDKHLSQLPPFLVNDSGVNSGFMIAQVTAAALASENKTLAHPASVDSLPTSANQEDHVSMATFAARKLVELVDNLSGIIAVEMLCAAQGVELRQPIKSSSKGEQAISIIRTKADFYEKDRYMASDIEGIQSLILAGKFNHFAELTKLPSIS
ncbi:histidine ammonia-lyase [Aliikangiella sp. IMCC44359]|uniref:histidine ammonia-lyase n=1 Tax=Aliikangiella sp. IMCC44359 TaxID=3459125 RepID=UPI00403A98D0